MGRTATALLVSLAAAGPAYAQGGAQGEALFSTHSLPSGQVTRFTVTCPPGYVAVDAAITTPDPQIRPLRDGPNPASQRAWDFGFINPVGAPDTTVTVRVSCIRVVAPKPLIVKQPRRTVVTAPKIVVKPFSEEDVKIACKKLLDAPVGSGETYDKSIPGPRFSQATPDVRVRKTASYPVPGGFETRFRNDGADDAEVTAQLVCFPRRATARPRRGDDARPRIHTLRVERHDFRGITKLPGRTTPLEASCGRDFALLAGHEFPAGSTLDLLGAHPVGKHKLRWATANFGQEPVKANYYAFCLNSGTRFRVKR